MKRKRLLESLDRGRSQKLTLVSGPAGSGKSTLLCQWLEESKLPSAWLSLDQADNDRRRFLSYLVGALRRVAPHVGAGGEALLDTADELVLGAALEHLVLLPLSDEPVDFVLVLDDLHVISDREIHQSLDLLLQHMPRGMHLALASRSEPPLSLARLRVQGEVNDVNAEDLRFRGDEALSLYNQTMGLDLDSAQVEKLEAKTEGWAAACQLVALRLRDGSGFDAAADGFSSDTRSIDYLVEELLDRQSEPVRDFLEGISILDRVCDSLAAALLDRSEPRITLAELERQNLLLIPLDDEGHWYRLHPLFSTALRRLLAERAPGREATLHRRASSWLSNQGLIHEAIEHAIASGDQELLAKLTRRTSVTIANQQHDVQTVARCLGALDRNVIDNDPLLLLAEAWCGRVTNDFATVEDCSIRLAAAMERLRWPAEVRNLAQPVMDAHRASGLRLGGNPKASIELTTRALRVGPPSSPLLSATYRMQVAALKLELGQAHLEMGNADEGLAALESAQHLAEDTDLLSVVFGSALVRAKALTDRGELGHAESVCERVLELAEKKQWNLVGMVGALHHALGFVHWMRGDTESAEFEIERGRQLSELIGDEYVAARMAWARALLKLARSDGEAALAEMRKGVELADSTSDTLLQRWTRARRALIDLRLGNHSAAERWASLVPLVPPDLTNFDHDIGQARVEIALVAEPDDAVLDAIETQLQRARDSGLVMYEIGWLVLEATARQRLGQAESASRALESAAVRARPEGYGVFFREPELRPLLAGFRDDENRKWAEAWSSEGARVAPPHPAATRRSDKKLGNAEPASPPLSPRELEVLELISQGLSNRKIAERLFLSLGTVKAHTHNINTKLETKSRTQAVHVARSLGLLPEGDAG